MVVAASLGGATIVRQGPTGRVVRPTEAGRIDDLTGRCGYSPNVDR